MRQIFTRHVTAQHLRPTGMPARDQKRHTNPNDPPLSTPLHPLHPCTFTKPSPRPFLPSPPHPSFKMVRLHRLVTKPIQSLGHLVNHPPSPLKMVRLHRLVTKPIRSLVDKITNKVTVRQETSRHVNVYTILVFKPLSQQEREEREQR